MRLSGSGGDIVIVYQSWKETKVYEVLTITENENFIFCESSFSALLFILVLSSAEHTRGHLLMDLQSETDVLTESGKYWQLHKLFTTIPKFSTSLFSDFHLKKNSVDLL